MQSERVSGLASSVLSEESGLAVTRLLGWDRPSATTKYTAVATATTTATADAAADANKDDYHRVAATDVAAGASQPRLCSAPNECPTRLRAFNGGAAPGSKPESERHRPLDGSAAAASMPESERDRPPDGASPPASASELRSPNGQCVARLEPWRFAVHGPGGVVSVVFQVAPDKTEPQLSGVQLQPDGSLVVLLQDGRVRWTVHAAFGGAYGPYTLDMQDDCNLVLHSNSRKLSLWGSSGSASASAWEAASVLLAALIAPPSAVMVPRSGDCHASDAYFHAYAPPVRAVTSHPDWMRQLPDGLRLGEMSIPGTHDSMAWRWERFRGDPGDPLSAVWDVGKTQAMTLQQQLDAGVRALDLRAALVSGVLSMYHGPLDLNVSLDGTLAGVAAFLAAHPHEVVLARLRHEDADGVPGHEPSPAAFLAAFSALFSAAERRGAPLFYRYNGDVSPRLGDVRGQVVLLQDFTGTAPGTDAPFGIPYSALRVQDHYALDSYRQLPGKFELVLAHMRAAAASAGAAIHLNFLNAAPALGGVVLRACAPLRGDSAAAARAAGPASTGFLAAARTDAHADMPASCLAKVLAHTAAAAAAAAASQHQRRLRGSGPSSLTLPYFCASGFALPAAGSSCGFLVDGAGRGVNERAVDEYRGWGDGRPVGMLMADFPGRRLIDTIVRQNVGT